MDKKIRVLAVDDELANLKLLKSILGPSEYDVAFALNGADAIKLLESDIYDVVLLDIMMPETDGYKVLERLRRWDRIWRTRVIVLSALDDVEGKLKAFDLGAVDYVTKPFNRNELLSRIKARLMQPTSLEMIGVSIRMLSHELAQNKMAIAALNAEPETCLPVLAKTEKRLNQLLLHFHLKKIEIRLNSVPIKRYMGEWLNSVKSQYNIEADIGKTAGLVLAADAGLLDKMFRAVVNFLSSRTSDGVQLVVRDKETHADFVFIDKGPMVSQEAIDAWFDPLCDSGEAQDVMVSYAMANANVIAQKHGGKIICDSKTNQTQIHIILPLRIGQQ
ncbi:response regulator [Shewanella sp. NIFS-20-20]|uniref:ATP-binding response regulator n=1 Tax=Shewanella sp. NIFS-20-20 TaxID=2853806 RepID=UPI001C4455AA|nr:response regulator [Shewanella sp. NIFS-20-20]MBV7315362.1 response regulator [Shewanella sp. NIFS-20-20]